MGLKTKPGDTVCAARGGVVTETWDEATLEYSGYSFASKDNYIEIYHDDCSFARYQVFRDKSIFVKPGESVVAGQPIGIAGGEKYTSGPHVRFSVGYYLEQEVLVNGSKSERKHYWAFVPLQFWTKENGKLKLANHAKYTSAHPEALITREMNKIELKKWKEKRF